MKITVGARLEKEVANAIEKKAKKDDRSVSWMINKILKESILNSK